MCGSRDGLMTVTGRKHNADDIIATVLAVEPMRFIYRGRIAVFSTRVLRDERICVIAEQRPECSEEEVGVVLLNFLINTDRLTEFPMDVPCSTSGGLNSSSGHLLFGPRAAELFTQDTFGRYSLVRDEASILGRDFASSQCASLPSYLCH